MARYDRTFLIPYLQDICALELARNKLQEECSRLDCLIQRFHYGSGVKAPTPPVLEEPSWDWANRFGAVLFFGVLVVGFLLSVNGLTILGIPLMLFGGVMGVYCFCRYRKERTQSEQATARRNYQRQYQYDEALAKYKRQLQYDQYCRENDLPNAETRRTFSGQS